MGTELSSIYDLFLLTVTDYRLEALYEASVEDFENYLEAWLRFAIQDFDNYCTQSLAFTNDNFDVVLTEENMIMLAMMMTKYWMQKNVNDITQMNLHVTDRDFKMASEANNLREKKDHLNGMTERISQALIDYSFKHTDWDSWFNQSFAGV